jgi:hypothetical protein
MSICFCYPAGKPAANDGPTLIVGNGCKRDPHLFSPRAFDNLCNLGKNLVRNVLDLLHCKRIPDSRAVSAFIGSIVLLGIWTYFISPGYPPPHELETFLGLIWGVFTGIGLAVGLGIIDFYQAAAGKLKVSRNWWRYLVLPAGGLLGALLWHFGGNWLFHPNPTAATQSSAIEAFTFGVSYTLGFVILIVWLLGSWARKSLKYSQMAATVVLMVVLGGTAALMGFLLAYYHPAFSNQKDIDLFVGITLRAGLAIAVGICFPPLLFPEFQNPKELTWIPWHGLYPSEKKDD